MTIRFLPLNNSIQSRSGRMFVCIFVYVQPDWSVLQIRLVDVRT